MHNKIIDLLLCRTGQRQVLVTEDRELRHGAGPLRSSYLLEKVEVGYQTERFRYAPGDWPWGRRLRFGFICGLLFAAVMGLWWLGHLVDEAFVPHVSWLHLPSMFGELTLPFAVSRLWDVPAALAWGFLLALTATSPLMRRLHTSRGSVGTDIAAIIVAGGIAAVIASVAIGIFSFVVVLIFVVIAISADSAVVVYGIATAVYLDIGFMLSFGCLASGFLHWGLAPALPGALVGLPLLLLGLHLTARWRAAS